MAEYIEREAIEYPYLYMSMWGLNSSTCKVYNEGVKAVHDVISAIPAADVVSRAAFDQVMWERDTAMEQLEEHGIPFGGEADVEPVKHGRWLQPKSGECFCSECQTNGSPQWKRCPVCEAKMNGGDAG